MPIYTLLCVLTRRSVVPTFLQDPTPITTTTTIMATLDVGLRGKLAVVTGSTKGIGFGIARAFLRHGALVVVNGRTPAAVEEAKARLVRETGVDAATIYALAADVGTRAGVDALIAQIDALGIPVEVLVNNTGIGGMVNFFEESDEKWQEYFDVNVLSGVRLTRHYLKPMLERKHGRVIFSSSVVAAVPTPNMLAYSVSKLSQAGIARALSELTKGTEVTVNSVLIGPTHSDVLEQWLADAESKGVKREDFIRQITTSLGSTYALGDERMQTVDEVADVFVFLASKQGLLVNGAAQHATAGVIRHVF